MLTEEERKRILAMMMQGQGLNGLIPRPPEPVQATPASPLPVAPVEAPIIAPQAEAAVAPPQIDPLAAIRAAAQGAAVQRPTGVKEVDAALAARAADQRAGTAGLLDVLAQAKEDPRIIAIRQAQEERRKKELSDIEGDQKRAAWNALARAGLAMSQSNSPYFMQALATGMEAGLNGLDKAKAAAAEKRSRLQAEDEESTLSAIRGEQSAQERAMTVYNAAIAAGRSEADARDAAVRSATATAQLPQTMELSKLELQGKRAQVAKDELELDRLRRTPLGGFGRGGGGGGGGGEGGGGGGGKKPLPPGARAEVEGRLATAYADQDEAYQNWVKLGKPLLGKVKQGTPQWLAASKYEASRGKVNNLLTTLGRPALGAAPTRPAPAAVRAPAAAAKSPKPKGFPGTQAAWDVMTPAEKKLFQ